MAGSREDATLIVELAKWGAMMDLGEAARTIWADDFDPEAADVVVRSGIPILMIGDAARRDSILVADDYDRAAAFRTRRSEFFVKSNALRRAYEMKYRGAAGSINGDPMAVALATDGTLGQRYMSVAMKVV